MDEEERKEQLEYERRRERRRAERRKRRRREMMWKFVLGSFLVLMAAVAAVEVWHLIKSKKTQPVTEEIPVAEKKVIVPPDYDVQLLDVNEYSRPGTALEQVRGIVIHYTANPGTTAQQNRDYFEGLSESGETYASSHFVIGLEGELIQCIPCKEIAYASNDRNSDTISIECCIPDESGQFSDATYHTLLHLVAWLMGRYDLDTDDVIRHYDVTGKNCPKYYVEHEDAWKTFKEDVSAYVETYGTTDLPSDTEENLPNIQE